jgi:putative membrane protein
MPERRAVSIALAMIGSGHFTVALAADQRSVDDEFIQQTTAIGALSLLASRLAAPQLTVPKLKRFANFEVADQETLWWVLDSLIGADPAREAKGDSPSESELEDHLVPLGRTILKNLRNMEAGTMFARDYFLLQVNVHQQLLRVQEDYLKLAPNPRWLGVVKLMDAATREHIGLLNEIKADTDSGKGTAQPGR